MQIHRVTVADHASGAAALTDAAASDLAIVVPTGTGLIAAEDTGLAETIALLDGGIAVGAGTTGFGEDAAFVADLEERLGGRPYRAHPHP
ncbi:MAG: hypothetical protein RL531_1579, partial [Actinomycetota bacterium]